MTRYAHPTGVFHVDPVPGQPQIAHCHGLFVFPECRGQGFGHVLKAEQMELLDALGFDLGTCTVDAGNHAQKAVLVRAGWKRLITIYNRRTCTHTELWGWVVDGETKPACAGDDQEWLR